MCLQAEDQAEAAALVAADLEVVEEEVDWDSGSEQVAEAAVALDQSLVVVEALEVVPHSSFQSEPKM